MRTPESFGTPERDGSPVYEKIERLKHMSVEDDDLHDRITRFARSLQRKYPKETFNSKLFHALIGSTPPTGIQLSTEDFPGEDSIERFVERMLKASGQ